MLGIITVVPIFSCVWWVDHFFGIQLNVDQLQPSENSSFADAGAATRLTVTGTWGDFFVFRWFSGNLFFFFFFFWLVVWNIFYFPIYSGWWSNLTNIFGMGWNHQAGFVNSRRAFFFVSSWVAQWRYAQVCLPTNCRKSFGVLCLGCMFSGQITLHNYITRKDG